MPHGFALQCRVTTEDPANNFMPDYGRLSHYRSASGMGIRLDAGTAFSGAVITPFYDSLLVKVTAHGLRFVDAARRMERCLQEFRVRGVKTNIPFLHQPGHAPEFLAGGSRRASSTRRPSCSSCRSARTGRRSCCTYIGEVIVNGQPGNAAADGSEAAGIAASTAPVPAIEAARSAYASPAAPAGGHAATSSCELGPEKFAQLGAASRSALLLTDTTFRDAHQSLLATRMRTYDMLRIAPVYAARHADLFSLEMWGGATFDTSMRFLKESPWERLAELRERIPNILFQMLLRAANAVGYTNYPDNVVKAFVKESAQAGIDLFRIFDALNWLPNLRLAIDAVRNTGMLCEAAICYTGDILDPKRTKYDLKYYVELAKELEKLGANLLAIKDMAGLCKPLRGPAAGARAQAGNRHPDPLPHARLGRRADRHRCCMAAEEGVDIVDAAMAPLSGMTSQPNLNTLVEALRFTPRDTGLDFEPLAADGRLLGSGAALLRAVRERPAGRQRRRVPARDAGRPVHQPVPAGPGARAGRPLAEICRHVCRGQPAVRRHRQGDADVKVVGDMALFMVANNLTPDDVLDGKRELAFPESVVEFFEGRLGQPPGGFPTALQKRMLRGRKPLHGRPGASLPPADFAATRAELEKQLQRPVNDRDVVTLPALSARVPRVRRARSAKYSDTSVLPTPVFFYGMEPGEEISVEIEPGKTLIIKFLTVGDPHPDGQRLVFFELNGQPREVLVLDRSLAGEVASTGPRRSRATRCRSARRCRGWWSRVPVAAGEEVAAGQKLLTLEAMKMETTCTPSRPAASPRCWSSPGRRSRRAICCCATPVSRDPQGSAGRYLATTGAARVPLRVAANRPGGARAAGGNGIPPPRGAR